jgi:hypothetical protein
MESIRSGPLAIVLVVLAVVFVGAGVLYALGIINFMTTHPSAKNHYTHAVVMGALALATLVAANLARPRSV